MRLFKVFLASLILCSALCPAMLSAQSKGTVLIVAEKTRFKKMLVAELDSLFTAAGYETTIVENSKKDVGNYAAPDYDAVFITNSGVNSRVRPWIVTWIDQNRSSGTYILLHTTQIRDWTVETPVDAVTSASSKDDVQKLAQEYFQRILRELEKADQAG